MRGVYQHSPQSYPVEIYPDLHRPHQDPYGMSASDPHAYYGAQSTSAPSGHYADYGAAVAARHHPYRRPSPPRRSSDGLAPSFRLDEVGLPTVRPPDNEQWASNGITTTPSPSLPGAHLAFPPTVRPAFKRRGKLPREVTDYLRTWLLNHVDHPYPTEEEKRQLCDATGLSMNQISNWFINARRRILTPIEPKATVPTE